MRCTPTSPSGNPISSEEDAVPRQLDERGEGAVPPCGQRPEIREAAVLRQRGRFFQAETRPASGFRGTGRQPGLPGPQQPDGRAPGEIRVQGIQDLKILLNAERGALFTALTASEAMFDLVRAVAENTRGENMVTTVLEHPSAYDSMTLYSGPARPGTPGRQGNPETGGVDAGEILRLIDRDTCLLNVMYGSLEHLRAVYDLETIVREARAINPGIYILVDAVQHRKANDRTASWTSRRHRGRDHLRAYKFFGCLGMGIAWLSERAAVCRTTRSCAWAGPLDSAARPRHISRSVRDCRHVSWIGGHYTDSLDRRELFAAGMTRSLHERAYVVGDVQRDRRHPRAEVRSTILS